MKHDNDLGEFLADVVMTSYYLAEPPRKTNTLLHDAEMKCLKIIETFGPLPMHDVAERIHVTKPRATQLICKLEQLGYVTRAIGKDHRVKYVAATTEGTEIVFELRKKYRLLAAEIESRLGPQKTSELLELLHEITPLAALMEPNNKGGLHEDI